jgi:dolichol-phosphate mannosyltransferase
MSQMLGAAPKVAVAIPTYKCKEQIEAVLRSMPAIVGHVYVVDDCCPHKTGQFVESLKLPQVTVLYHSQNQGVGGAVMTGFLKALGEGFEVLVKIDGDGQMDASLIPDLIDPILRVEADYTKGNRFYYLKGFGKMPLSRLVGNAGLSMINKMVSGYWGITDPTNGFVAIHAEALRMIESDKLAKRYFFESDLLFRLSTVKAVVVDVPMFAHYGDEKSNLSVFNSLVSFPAKYLNRMLKRIFYNYFVRDFSIGSVALIGGVLMSLVGLFFGSYHWIKKSVMGHTTPIGTVMITALLLIFGFQALILFIQIDIAQVPRRPLQKNSRFLRKAQDRSRLPE